MGGILRARAFLLYHYLPYDKSLWGRLRSPPSLALQLIASWPELAVRATFFAVLLLCLLYDLEENQLMKFVLALKSTQFLTGLYFALSGYFLFWRCDVFYQPGVCDSAGPGVGHSPVRDFMSIVGLQAMVYLAILLLPYSVQCGELRETQVLDAKASADAAAAAAAAAKAAAADAADAAAAAGRRRCRRRRRGRRRRRASLAAAHDFGVFGAPLAVADRGCADDADACRFGRVADNVAGADAGAGRLGRC